MGYPIYFRQRGYLFTATEQKARQDLQSIHSRLAELHIATELLTSEQISATYPFVFTDDLLGGSYCPLDAYADPYGVMEGYYRQSRKLGVQLICNAEVTSLKITANSVSGVLYRVNNQNKDSELEMIETPLVINAAGLHLHLIARMAGLELPAMPHRRQVHVCAPMPVIPPSIPLVADVSYREILRVQLV